MPKILFDDEPLTRAEKVKEALRATTLPFAGAHYDKERDKARLTGQILRVFNALQSGEWLTLPELRDITRDPIASISAQIRNLRKPAFGSHQILKKRRGRSESGLFEYRLFQGKPKSETDC